MKRRKFLQIASGAAACSVARFTQTRAQMTGFQGRSSLSLNGTWDFQMDPKNEGLTVMPGAELGKWFTADAAYSHRIEVPGCWQAQGFGPPNRHLRHDYQGKAWYRRIARVPADWTGKRIWLHIGGASNYADVFVNHRSVGAVEGFLTPYEFDVTEHIRPGAENVIVCRVDSGGPAPIGLFNFMGRWGGLYREVFLEERSDPVIDDLFVQPDVKNRRARTQVVLKRSTAGPAWKGELLVKIQPEKGGPSAQGRELIGFSKGSLESETALVDVTIPEMRTWSPEDPFLYKVEVTLLEEEQPIDRVGDRFGMRQLEVGSGGVLLLNQRPYFVRGVGDCNVEPLTGILAADKQVYIERWSMAKRYGFNGARFLGHTPAREVFEAADEVGFLIQCEGEVYGPGKGLSGWPTLTASLSPAATSFQYLPSHVVPLLKKQVTRIAKAYRNHPSWYVWGSGNEFFEALGDTPNPIWMDYIQYANDTFRKLDPTRFFVSSAGAAVLPTDDILTANFDSRHLVPPEDPKYPDRPLIWHEFPNTYAGPLPDLTIADKWTGVYQDYGNISHYRHQVRELELSERYAEDRQRSIDLFYLYLKSEFENARHSKSLDGYDFWSFTDYPGDVEGDGVWWGMFSSVYEAEKFPDPKSITKFNRETVLVIGTPVERRVYVRNKSHPGFEQVLDERILGENETRTIPLHISHYGSQPIRDGKIVWGVRAEGQVLQQDVIEGLNVEVGEVKQIGTLQLGPYRPSPARRLQLSVRLESEACRQENDWDLWAFPDQELDLEGSRIRSLIPEPDRDDTPSESLSLEQASVVLTDRMTDRIAEYAGNGGSVLLIAEQGVLTRTKDLPFWPPMLRTSGTFVEEHPALAGFPHDGFCSFQFYRLFGGLVEAADTTAAGTVEREKLVPIVWGLTTNPFTQSEIDPLSNVEYFTAQNRWKLYRHGIVCEGRIGKGKLLLCTLKVLGGVQKGYPEATSLLKSLLKYALSAEFSPESSPMTQEDLRQVFVWHA